MAMNGDARPEYALHVMFHEYTHYYLASQFAGEYPPWFNEGLAELMGYAKFSKDNRAVLQIPMYRVYEARDGNWIPFERLIRVDRMAGTPAGDVTLFELATHTSGLPSIPPDIAYGTLADTLGNENPYEVSVEQVIEASRTVELKDQGEYAYSNLGMSLLGHAEARAAGVADWPTLATQRILQPLGMTATTFALTEADIPDDALDGHQGNGWRAATGTARGSLPPGRRPGPPPRT